MDKLVDWPLASLLVLDNDFFPLFLDWVKEDEQLKEMVLFLLESDSKRFPHNRMVSVQERLSKTERILEHYFMTPSNQSATAKSSKDLVTVGQPRLNVPPNATASIIKHLQKIICDGKMPLFALFSSLCDNMWVEVLKRGSTIIGSQQYWPSIRRQIVSKEAIDVIQVIQDNVLKSYFVKFLSLQVDSKAQTRQSSKSVAAANRNVACLQCFEIVSLLISSLEYTKRKFKKAQKQGRDLSPPKDSEMTYHIPSLHSTESGQAESPYEDPVRTFGVLLTDARTLYQQFFSEKRLQSMQNSGRGAQGNAMGYVPVAGISDATKHELASVLQETASVYLAVQPQHITTLNGSHDVDDGLYAIDPTFALENALRIEKAFLAIETECFRYLQQLFARFTESTEYVFMMAYIRSLRSEQVRDYKRYLEFLEYVKTEGLVRWREEKARGVTYIRYSMPENSSTVSRPAGIAVMNADKSLRRSLDMMVLCADFDFSDDIPLLPANGKYSYDSDELNISNIHLYTGDLGDPGYASLFTGVNARTSCSTAQTPPLSRISGLFNNGKEDTNPVADAEQDEQLPVLKTLDSASIEDIWNKQPESVRARTKKPHWWCADIIRRLIRDYHVLPVVDAGEQLSAQSLQILPICVSYAYVENQELYGLCGAVQGRRAKNAKTERCRSARIQLAVSVSPKNTDNCNDDVLDAKLSPSWQLKMQNRRSSRSQYSIAFAISQSSVSVFTALRAAATAGSSGRLIYAVERALLENQHAAPLTHPSSPSTPRVQGTAQRFWQPTPHSAVHALNNKRNDNTMEKAEISDDITGKLLFVAEKKDERCSSDYNAMDTGPVTQRRKLGIATDMNQSLGGFNDAYKSETQETYNTTPESVAISPVETFPVDSVVAAVDDRSNTTTIETSLTPEEQTADRQKESLCDENTPTTLSSNSGLTSQPMFSSPMTSVRDRLRKRREDISSIRKSPAGISLSPVQLTENGSRASAFGDDVNSSSPLRSFSKSPGSAATVPLSPAMKNESDVAPISDVVEAAHSQPATDNKPKPSLSPHPAKPVKTTMATLRAMLNLDYVETPTPKLEEVLEVCVTRTAAKEDYRANVDRPGEPPSKEPMSIQYPGFSDAVGIQVRNESNRCLVFAVPCIISRTWNECNASRLSCTEDSECSYREKRGLLALLNMYGFGGDNSSPFLDYGLDSVVFSLSPRLLISLVLLLLTDKNILLVSRSCSLLSKTMSALHAITAPFRLHKTHVTRMLASKVTFVEWTKTVIGQSLWEDGSGGYENITDEAERVENGGPDVDDEDDADDHEFDIDLDASVGRGDTRFRLKSWSRSNHHQCKDAKGLSVVTLGGHSSDRPSHGGEVDWFNSPVKTYSPRSSPKASKSITTGGCLDNYRSPAAFSFDSPAKSNDSGSDVKSPLTSSDAVATDPQHVFFAATTASRVRQQAGFGSPNLPSVAGRKPLQPMNISPMKAGNTDATTPIKASDDSGGHEVGCDSHGDYSSGGHESFPSETELCSEDDSDGPRNEHDNDEDTDDEHTPYSSSGSNAVDGHGNRFLCGVTTSVFSECGFSVVTDLKADKDTPTQANDVQRLLRTRVVVVDIDNCQVDNNNFEEDEDSIAGTKISVLLVKLREYLNSSQSNWRSAKTRKSHVAGPESMCRQGALDRLELELRRTLRRIAQDDNSVSGNNTSGLKYDKVCRGYRVVDDGDSIDGGIDCLPNGEDKICSSNIKAINDQICGTFFRFYVEVALCGLPACVDYFADMGVVSCDILHFLKVLDVSSVFSTAQEPSFQQTISNHRNGHEHLSVQVYPHTAYMSGVAGNNDAAAFVDVESAFIAEFVDSTALIDFIYRHGSMLEQLSTRANNGASKTT